MFLPSWCICTQRIPFRGRRALKITSTAGIIIHMDPYGERFQMIHTSLFTLHTPCRMKLLLLVLLCTMQYCIVTANSQRPPPPPPTKPLGRRLQTSQKPAGEGPMKVWAYNVLKQQHKSDGTRASPLTSTGVSVGPPLQNPSAGESKMGTQTMDSGLSLRPAPDGVSRPFKIAFYNAMDLSQHEDVVQYVMGELVPAAASLYRRHMRVRYPSGKLHFHGRTDMQQQPIPTGRNGEGVHT